ncbi:MAG: hypothetical protein LBG27_06825 [Spirochaetaceae bacterium]|jgi:hypothetical protein|nr:hypothetical protein [Spirochaetaceae bacterium]
MPGNESFDGEEILRARHEAAIRRMAGYGGTVLAVQDTAGADYNTRLKTEGIGYISGKTRGVTIHSCLAASSDGLVLGVSGRSNYNRPEAKDESASHDSKKARPIEEKESFRRLETLERSAQDMPEGVRMITACDREGDMAD